MLQNQDIQLLNVVSAAQNNLSSSSSTSSEASPAVEHQRDGYHNGSTSSLNESYYSNGYGNGNGYSSSRDTSASDNTNCSMRMRSYSRWAPSKQGATLVWRDVCVYATGDEDGRASSGQNLKRIINNSSGAIQPGTLMALMGSR